MINKSMSTINKWKSTYFCGCTFTNHPIWPNIQYNTLVSWFETSSRPQAKQDFEGGVRIIWCLWSLLLLIEVKFSCKMFATSATIGSALDSKCLYWHAVTHFPSMDWISCLASSTVSSPYISPHKPALFSSFWNHARCQCQFCWERLHQCQI